MNNNITENEYKKWERVVISAQLVIAIFVFLTDAIDNTILYVTRSQGYGPDTIVQKLLRYLVLTTVVNFGLVIISKVLYNKIKNETKKPYYIMLITTFMCSFVAYSHYQFTIAFGIFTVPLIICILFENWSLSKFTAVISMLGVTAAVIARAKDPAYNKDIGPEAAIAYILTFAMLVLSKLIIGALQKRRNEVKDAVVEAEKANADVEKMELSFTMLETLAGTIDAKDKYTNGHSIRVANYSTILAKELGWSEEQIKELRFEALLHDIGKIGVPDVILNKPSKLTETEFELIKSHTVVGSDILKNMVSVPNATFVAKHHHERYDGKGYPGAIKGEEIPINARIVCIADSYDAMNSDRIYRFALPKDVIRKELIKGRGSQFDPELLDVFLKLFDEHKLGDIAAETMFNHEEDTEQQNAMNDIERVINRISSMSEQMTSVKEFELFYKYMRNIGLRYNRSIEVVFIDIVNVKGKVNVKNEEKLAEKLQIAIRKNIRTVDVYYQNSTTRHMIILLDAGIENIEIIWQRIKFDFDSLKELADYELKFTLSENIEASGEWKQRK